MDWRLVSRPTNELVRVACNDAARLTVEQLELDGAEAVKDVLVAASELVVLDIDDWHELEALQMVLNWGAILSSGR